MFNMIFLAVTVYQMNNANMQYFWLFFCIFYAFLSQKIYFILLLFEGINHTCFKFFLHVLAKYTLFVSDTDTADLFLKKLLTFNLRAQNF